MARYVIFLPGDEDRWATASEQEKAAMYAAHDRFGAALGERGHTVVAGAELTHSRRATTLRAGGDGVVSTEGPFAELAEQITGFYLVESEDRADLLDVCRILAEAGENIEVRQTGPITAEDAS